MSMSLYTRIEDVAVRDFEFLRLLSKESLDVLVDKVFAHVRDYEGEDSKEGFIHQCIMEEVAHLLAKGLLLEGDSSPDFFWKKLNYPQPLSSILLLVLH